MPKHKHHKKEKEHHSRGHSRESRDDRHGRDDRRDSERGGRQQSQEYGGRNRNDYSDRDRNRDRDRSRESGGVGGGSGSGGNGGRYQRDSNTRHSYNGGGSGSDRSRDRGNEHNPNQRHSFPKGGNYSGSGSGNNRSSYGYGPPGQLPPPPGVNAPLLPFGFGGGGMPVPMIPMMPLPGPGFFPGYPPLPNQFNPHMYNNRRGGDFRGGDDRGRKRDREQDFPRGSHSSHSSSSRPDWEHSKRPRYDQEGQFFPQRDIQEEMRLTVSQHAPNKQFLEEVELAPEYAFRIDTRPNVNHLRYSSLNLNNASRFEPTYRRDDIFGASEEELSSLPFRSVFSRCVRPVGIDDDGNQVDEDGNLLDEDGKPMNYLNDEEKAAAVAAAKNNKPKKSKRKHAPIVASSFISFDKPKLKISASASKEAAIEPRYQIQKEKSISIRDQVESFNVELRKDPKNIELWRKFVKFQDQVLEHEAEELGGIPDERQNLGKKFKAKKTNKKALAEKKIAILDRALEANPKNLDLHADRMNLLYEIFKPRYVLGEWKKLVTVYQQLAPFWDEYLRFGATQLQLYSSSAIIGTFEKAFQKFRLMLNPHYPKFQRPDKFLLLISDLVLGLGLVLRNSGFLEKAIALHQAQCEVNFNFPKELVSNEKDKPIDWASVNSVFELFWDAGTQRFGETVDASGWAEFIKNKPQIKKVVLGVSEKQLQEWEDQYFDTINSEDAAGGENSEEKKSEDKATVSQHWVTVESFRSTFQWLPWRENSSDANSCEDNQRIVLANELSPFLTLIPEPINNDTEDQPFITNFDRNSAHFRTVMNFLLLLQDDFLPHTQTVDSILSSFLSSSLSKTNTFFSEIYYWKIHLNLYMNKLASDDKKIVIPDGFSLNDFISPGPPVKKTTKPVPVDPVDKPNSSDEAGDSTAMETASPMDAEPKELDPPKEETESEKLLSTLSKSNYDKYDGMVRTIVEKAVDKLDVKFASVLAQSYLRFEQRSTFYDDDTTGAAHKSRMKFAKNLLQNEKLRNSIPLYCEMALLEFYGSKSKTKANGILVKAINSTSENLRSKFIGGETGATEAEVISNWEIIAEVTRLHRILAELNLNGSNCKNVSLRILAALGNNFQGIQFPLDEDAQDLTTNEMLIARRQFEKVYAILFPGETKSGNKTSASETEEIVNLWDGNKSVDFLVQNTNFIVEWICSFALFLYLSTDFASASELFTKVLKKISRPSLNKSTKYQSSVVSASNIREQLYLMWCKIGILEIEKNPMQNGKFRNILVEALTEFPASPPLLLIFTDVEKQSSIAGKIWRLMTGTIKNESSVSSLHWASLFMALGLARKVDELRHDEEVGLPSFGLGGPAVPPDTIFYKLDAVLTTAEQNPASRNCPLIWRIHLNLTADRSKRSKLTKDSQTARGMFYDAIRNCPTLKILYMDALTYFPDNAREIHDLFTEKGIYVRLPLEELNVLLEKEADDDVIEEDEDEDEEGSENDKHDDGDKIDSDEEIDDELIEEKPGKKNKRTKNKARKISVENQEAKKASAKEIESLPSGAVEELQAEPVDAEESMSEGEIGE